MLVTLASVLSMLPAAASTAAVAPVAGEVWRVLGAFPTALYLGGPDRAVLPVVTADALLLPNAWRLGLPSSSVTWGVRAGEPVGVDDDGSLHLGDLVVRPVRTWTPRAVHTRTPPSVRRAPPSRNCTHPHAAFATAGLAAASDWTAWTIERLGLGPGLTPDGDDELCGALLVAHATGDDRLRAAVEPLLARTTDLSAALLRCAGDGLAVPELTAFVDALLAGDERADRLRPAVLAIGHSSGPALVRGVEAALATLDEGVLVRA